MEKKQDLLAGRLNAGDSAAAAEFVDIYYERIYLFLRRLGHSRQVSEDLTQECFLQAWQHIGQLRDDRVLKSWLYRIAGNVSKNYWRRHHRRDLGSIEGFDVSDSSETEQDKIVYLEQLEQVQNAVLKLPVKFRQVVILHYMEHLTIAEAAEAAGVREGTFKSRLSRALKALRKQLDS